MNAVSMPTSLLWGIAIGRYKKLREMTRQYQSIKNTKYRMLNIYFNYTLLTTKDKPPCLSSTMGMYTAWTIWIANDPEMVRNVFNIIVCVVPFNN